MTKRTSALLAIAGLFLVAGSAQAQPPAFTLPMTGSVALAVVPVAALGTAVATVGNPAEVGLLPTWSLLGGHAQAREADSLAAQGDGVYFALPIAFGLAAGGGVERVVPTDAAGGSPAGRGTFAVALASPSRRFAFGASWSGTALEREPGVERSEFNLGLAARPSSTLALGLTLRNLLGPADLDGMGTRRSGPAAVLLSAALRPTGRRGLELDASGQIDSDRGLAARAGAQIGVPYVGNVLGAVELSGLEESRPVLMAWGGIQVSWGAASASGGVIVGDGLAQPGWYVEAELRGASAPGVPRCSYAREIEVSGLDERGILALSVELESIGRDDDVAAVLLRMRTGGLPMSYAQELRASIARLRARGKRVVCHLETATGTDVYACAGADRTLIDPAGGVRLVGPTSEVVLLGELFENVGVRGEFLRIGDYKSAPEQLTNRAASAPAREQRQAYLDEAYGRLTRELGADIGRTEAEMRTLIDDGPFVAQRAVTAGLVDGLADGLDMEDALTDAFGADLRLKDDERAALPDRWGPTRGIGVVVIDGNIVDGESMDVPLLGIHLSGGQTIAEAIEQLADDSRVKVIVLRVDSPGGSVLAADQIWRAAMRARAKKPVIASMGSVAASGGYYVAAAASEIWADPTTLTGSIGIFYGKVDLAGLADRIGIAVDVMERGAHAGMDSLWRPLDAEERLVVAEGIRTYYRLFLQRIAEGRGMELAAIDSVARGRVWSGEAAASRGLVDHLGSMSDALDRARELGDLPPDADIQIVPRAGGGIVDFLMGDARAGSGPAHILELPAPLRRAAAVALTLGHTASGIPLALLEY